MSTGISISSINRIKELAEEKKFKEALEILDTQDLDKSINPQFLRISGEIFRENRRYYDSRKFLLKAHQMSPQGNRIIRELIELYLELGYFSKAQKYYEQYMFYTTPEDTQKEFVEYIMKKATGSDVKDLAAILIPVLERMPGDQWNFEAILLYHKMDRKDMALEESRYILENFKESVYVQPVIDYIDEQLDVDEWFYVYPKEEVPEDEEIYGDLIALEEKILEADYRLMYPPEARIMVEADDKDAEDVKPAKAKKEKKNKKRVGKNSKKKGKLSEENEQQSKDDVVESDKLETSGSTTETTPQIEEQDGVVAEEENAVALEEARIQKEREVALEKLLSRKIDKDRLKESAQQAAQAVKEIDVASAKKQVKIVVDSVKDNVKKASDALGEAVGAIQTDDTIQESSKNNSVADGEKILDGIIESVLEPPKKMVGEIVMNEELDALIPDSLEAMSEQEAADIEARKEEMERLELEALEAALKLEEEKKAKKNARAKRKELNDAVDEEEHSEKSSSELKNSEETEAKELVSDSEQEDLKNSETASMSVKEDDAKQTSMSVKEDDAKQTSMSAKEDDTKQTSMPAKEDDSKQASTSEESDKLERTSENVIQSDGTTYEELKSRFMEAAEEQPLDSLGFITVVHSDVDEALEDAMPDAAGILRQMIDNKEFYSGENSLGFESKASYENHGFEIEDYDFEVYRMPQDDLVEQTNVTDIHEISSSEEAMAPIEEIYTKKSVVAFEDVVSEEVAEEPVAMPDEEEVSEKVLEEPVEEPVVMPDEEEVSEEVLEEPVEEPVVMPDEEEVSEEVLEEPVEEPVVMPDEEEVSEEVLEEPVEEPVVMPDEEEVSKKVLEEPAEESVVMPEEEEVPEQVSEEPIEKTVATSDVEEVSEEAPEGPIEESVADSKDRNIELSVQEYMNYLMAETEKHRREKMRADIRLSERMRTILLELKESR